MAKRFRDTKLSREVWYRKLKPAYKCVWDFLCDECDEAGIWSIDNDALAFFIGEEISLSDFLNAVNADRHDNPRVEMYGKDKIFITGFVEFQYGQLSESCVPHRKIISLLKKYNILDRVYIPYTKGTDTLKEKKGKEEDKEEDKDERGSGGKQIRRPALKGNQETQQELKARYTTIVEDVKKMVETKMQKEELARFITENRPQFIEPYADLWNISVVAYGLSQVESLSDGRLKKFKTRAREPAFDFIKILSEIRQSDYLRGKLNNWKADWDWIMENDTNYLKIIEGKYRNTQN